MGTNYYLHKPLGQKLHVGKSSGGWCFALHVIENGPRNLKDWTTLFKRPNKIVDEYGRKISRKEMLSIITDRTWKKNDVPVGYKDWEDFHRYNYSEDGPNGLVRCKIDGRCIGHEDGTWDLVTGDFS